ncbi:transposase domain-containing protein [Streptomyces sp. NPDC091376]|uniref:transposase domain-containing protein n=1 Tax=Streptomyces sp. NPDC091376 TaxID=3365994 RepID=UPI0038224A0F
MPSELRATTQVRDLQRCRTSGCSTGKIPPHVVGDVLDVTGCRERRMRLLPARVDVHFIVAMALFSTEGSPGAWASLMKGPGPLAIRHRHASQYGGLRPGPRVSLERWRGSWTLPVSPVQPWPSVAAEPSGAGQLSVSRMRFRNDLTSDHMHHQLTGVGTGRGSSHLQRSTGQVVQEPEIWLQGQRPAVSSEHVVAPQRPRQSRHTQ